MRGEEKREEKRREKERKEKRGQREQRFLVAKIVENISLIYKLKNIP